MYTACELYCRRCNYIVIDAVNYKIRMHAIDTMIKHLMHFGERVHDVCTRKNFGQFATNRITDTDELHATVDEL